MRSPSCALVLVLCLGTPACGEPPSQGDTSESESESGGAPETGETGEPADCGAYGFFEVWLTGPFGTDSPTDAPLLQALTYESKINQSGQATTCPCGSDCTNMPVDTFAFGMHGLPSLPTCFTVEYAVREGEGDGAWIVFRDATEGSAGQLVLAAGVDPYSVPPSLAGLELTELGYYDCSDGSAPFDVRYTWGEASLELGNGESGPLETPMGTMTIYNVSSGQPFEGAKQIGWIMVPEGTVLGG